MRIAIYLGRHRGSGGGIGTYARALVLSSWKYVEGNSTARTEVIIYGDRSILSEEVVKDLQASAECPLSTAADTVFRNHPSRRLLYKKLPTSGIRTLDMALDQIFLALLLRYDRVPLVHCLANYGLLGTSSQQLITVHDLFQAFPPATTSSGSLRKRLIARCYRALFFMQFRKAAWVFTDCSTVAQEIFRRYALPLSKIQVVPLGLDEAFLRFWEMTKHCPARDQEQFHAERPPGYVLLHFSTDPRKNLARMLEAWLSLSSEDQQRGLLVLGSGASEHDLVRQMTERSSGPVHLVPWVSRTELPLIYANAGVVLVPSLAEGFGYPAIEALSCGTQVVSGPIEVLGGKAHTKEGVFLCDPEDSLSIASALKAALHSGPISKIQTFSSVDGSGNGHPRPRSMDDVFKEYLETYRRLMYE